jgi:hypothetical protein
MQRLEDFGVAMILTLVCQERKIELQSIPNLELGEPKLHRDGAG